MSILSSQTLTISVSSAVNEKVLKDILKVIKADVDVLEQEFEDYEKLAVKKALNIVRDAGGKIVSIDTLVPTDLVATLVPDLLAIPGVIDVTAVSTSIPPEVFVGADGTSLTAFTGLGFSEILFNVAQSLTPDGHILQTFSGGFSSWQELNQNGPIPLNAKGLTHRTVLKQAPNRQFRVLCLDSLGTGSHDAGGASWEFVNATYLRVKASPFQGNIDASQTSGLINISALDRSVMHAYEMKILPNQGGVTFTIDGVAPTMLDEGSYNGSGYPLNIPNNTLSYRTGLNSYFIDLPATLMQISSGGGNGTQEIDKIEWTKP